MTTKMRDTAAARFEGRVLANVDALFNRAMDLTGSRRDAAELVVETCVRAWRGFENNGPEIPSKGWLYSIMFSIFANERPSEARRPEIEAAKELELSQSDGAMNLFDGRNGGPMPGADFEWSGAEIAAIVDQLPEELRGPVILVDVDMLTYEDAARVLRCSVSSLRTRLFRARRALFLKLRNSVRIPGHAARTALS